jgi:ribosomal protein S6--L-glutamate ligase
MILSFHPCFDGDKNIICAGRKPDRDDLLAIKAADAVILPQGCKESLYKVAKENCPNVFPNFDARFRYKDKIGQFELFREKSAPFPDTKIFRNLDSFYKDFGRAFDPKAFTYPFVFKFDWGGEGETVFLIKSFQDLQNILKKAADFEKTGQAGFLIQEYIVSQAGTLRVVIINKKLISYWRVQKDSDAFYSNISKDAIIDHDSDPIIQKQAMSAVAIFCKETDINLAGFDILFTSKTRKSLFLEINYFFGRKGLGGSENFYKTLVGQINRWIASKAL